MRIETHALKWDMTFPILASHGSKTFEFFAALSGRAMRERDGRRVLRRAGGDRVVRAVSGPDDQGVSQGVRLLRPRHTSPVR